MNQFRGQELTNQLKQTSRFMSLILRHRPDKIDLSLDKEGYAEVDELCSKLHITAEELDLIVETNSKKRFAFNSNKTKIRASQGHSIDVDLELQEVVPPQLLFHGTKDLFLKNILKEGLQKRSRHHVHLSDNINTAQQVADRRNGKSIILKIRAMEMRADDFKFYKSANGVYLTDSVPAKYISVN